MKRVLLLLCLAPFAAMAQTAPPKTAPTLRSILLSQLRSTHMSEEWFVPVNVAVAGLTPAQAKWVPKSEGPNNPAPADHSVGMITNHLLFWNAEVLAHLKGQKGAEIPGDNKETFNDFDATSWPSTAQRLDQVLNEIEHMVEASSDADLQKMADSIAHVSTHNAYHVGQIIYIRKLQGTWDPNKGVKQ